MNKEHIIQYLTGQLNGDERKHFHQTLDDDVELKQEFIKQKNLWALSSSVVINKNTGAESESEQFLYNLSYKKEDENKSKRISRKLSFYKIAAIIMFGLLVGSTVYILTGNRLKANQEQIFYTDIYVPKGEKSELTLSDGTRIFINADTKVSVPSNFSNKNRRLWIEGEAYFNVKHNSRDVFIVETPSINVEVLGTSFDLSCYADDEIVTTVLDEGSVRFSGANNLKVNGALLKPGETARYHKASGVFKIEETKEEGFASAWKEGQLKFKDIPFHELARKIERLYNVEIEIDDVLKFERYTGEIDSKSVWAVMNHFAIATPFDVKANGRKIKVTAKKNFK